MARTRKGGASADAAPHTNADAGADTGAGPDTDGTTSADELADPRADTPEERLARVERILFRHLDAHGDSYAGAKKDHETLRVLTGYAPAWTHEHTGALDADEDRGETPVA